jgi:hypothetical protein
VGLHTSSSIMRRCRPSPCGHSCTNTG